MHYRAEERRTCPRNRVRLRSEQYVEARSTREIRPHTVIFARRIVLDGWELMNARIDPETMEALAGAARPATGKEPHPAGRTIGGILAGVTGLVGGWG